LGQTKFALQQTAFPGEDGRMPHRDAQQIRDDRFTRSSPTFHRARSKVLPITGSPDEIHSGMSFAEHSESDNANAAIYAS
jgi:hypothetical protein